MYKIIVEAIRKGVITEIGNILFGIYIITRLPKILKAMKVFKGDLTKREIFYFLVTFLVGSLIIVVIIHKPF